MYKFVPSFYVNYLNDYFKQKKITAYRIDFYLVNKKSKDAELQEND